jgi:hypothetical protein
LGAAATPVVIAATDAVPAVVAISKIVFLLNSTAQHVVLKHAAVDTCAQSWQLQ